MCIYTIYIYIYIYIRTVNVHNYKHRTIVGIGTQGIQSHLSTKPLRSHITQHDLNCKRHAAMLKLAENARQNEAGCMLPYLQVDSGCCV